MSVWAADKVPPSVSLSVSVSLSLAVDACFEVSCVVREVRCLVLELLYEVEGGSRCLRL